jgi:hypothetical protein
MLIAIKYGKDSAKYETAGGVRDSDGFAKVTFITCVMLVNNFWRVANPPSYILRIIISFQAKSNKSVSAF